MKYRCRLQHVLARMNYHIHPVCNPETGERKPLKSCLPKGKKKGCRSNFPLDAEMCEQPTLVCACIATQQGLPVTGPRSYIGTVLSARNSPWLNAGPPAWIAFAGDNGDIKFPYRMPITVESHENEKVLVYDCTRTSMAQQISDLQAAQSMAAGYFGGYSAKMQDIGRKELERMGEALDRKVVSNRSPAAKQ